MKDEEILMRKSRFTEAQIMDILRQVDGGLALADVCREHGISSATFYKWRVNTSPEMDKIFILVSATIFSLRLNAVSRWTF